MVIDGWLFVNSQFSFRTASLMCRRIICVHNYVRTEFCFQRSNSVKQWPISR